MDYLDAAMRLGLPAIALFFVAKAYKEREERLEKQAADREAALVAALMKEREFKDNRLVEMTVKTTSVIDDAIDLMQDIKTVLTAKIRRSGTQQ